MTNEKKEAIKNRAKKVLHIICYILSALFILTLVIAGLQNCKGKTTGVHADNSDYTYVYSRPTTLAGQEMPSDGVLTPSQVFYNQWLSETLGSYELPNDRATFSYNYFANDTYIKYKVNGDTFGADNIRLSYRKIDNQWILLSVSYAIKNDSNNYVTTDSIILTNTSTGQLAFSNFEFSASVLKPNDALFDIATYSNERYRFLFNRQFNYNAPFEGNLGQYGLPTTLVDNPPSTLDNYFDTYENSQTLTFSVWFDTTYFMSGGQRFNRVKLEYQMAGGFYVSYNNVAQLQSEASLYYTSMQYIDTDTNNFVVVNYRNYDTIADSNGTMRQCLSNTTTWAMDSYRLLEFETSLSDKALNTLRIFNNNSDTGYYFDNGGEANVFTLLSGALGCWLPILGMSILPGVTIGMIALVPLVVAVILFIVHSIKK